MTAGEILTAGSEVTADGVIVPVESLIATEAVIATFMGKVVEGRLIEVVAVSFSYWILP